jgi:hypothetical protein
MMLTLAPKSQIASLKFMLPMEIEMTGLPRSPFLIGRVSPFHPFEIGSLQLLLALNMSTGFAVSRSSGCLRILPWLAGGTALASCCN